MKFEDLRKQMKKAVSDAMKAENLSYSKLIDEEPDGAYEYGLMRRAGIMGIGNGAIAVIKITDITDRQKSLLESDINNLVSEYKDNCT